MSDHTAVFQRYYHERFWGNDVSSSGPNSDAHFTPKLIQRLQLLLDDLQVESILDAGCGDANLWHHLRLLDGTSYLGIDCVPELIQQCQQAFKAYGNMEFAVRDVLDPLPQADCVISRDVVHYLPNELIQCFLDQVKESGAKYLLITHNTHCHASANEATEIGIFRPVNLTYAPFFLPKPIRILEEDFIAKSLALWEVSQL